MSSRPRLDISRSYEIQEQSNLDLLYNPLDMSWTQPHLVPDAFNIRLVMLQSGENVQSVRIGLREPVLSIHQCLSHFHLNFIAEKCIDIIVRSYRTRLLPLSMY